MSNRARQLLLEILLLSEQYSGKEIEWVRQQLRVLPRVSQPMQLLDLLREERTEPRIEKRKDKPLPKPGGNRSALDEFIASLEMDQSTKGVRRVEAAAKRLGVPLNGQTHNELVQELRAALNRLKEDELGRFLRPYKRPLRADEDYVGLANFIMKTTAETE